MPVYLDSTVVGMFFNVIALIIGSALTQVSEEEKQARNRLFIVPETEKEPKEVRRTLNYMKAVLVLGAVVSLILLFVWAVPYMKG